MYARILQDILSKDEYFKDFKIKDYRDIIIFRGSDTPLVWEIPFTFTLGTLYLGKGNQIVFKDPCDIGKELYYYLNNNVKVPKGINLNETNDIRQWINIL